MTDFKLDTGHWTLALGTFKERITTAQLREALISGPHFVRGQLCDVKSKRLGADIHEVWMAVCAHEVDTQAFIAALEYMADEDNWLAPEDEEQPMLKRPGGPQHWGIAMSSAGVRPWAYARAILRDGACHNLKGASHCDGNG